MLIGGLNSMLKKKQTNPAFSTVVSLSILSSRSIYNKMKSLRTLRFLTTSARPPASGGISPLYEAMRRKESNPYLDRSPLDIIYQESDKIDLPSYDLLFD